MPSVSLVPRPLDLASALKAIMSFISRVLNHFVNQVLVDTLANRCEQQLCLA